jgi:XTP/dITP diphosphohydrolase
LLYRDTEPTIVGEGTTRGRLVAPPRGASGFGWDPVFVPLDESATCAELGEEVKDRIGPRGRAWRDLLVKLG